MIIAITIIITIIITRCKQKAHLLTTVMAI